MTLETRKTKTAANVNTGTEEDLKQSPAYTVLCIVSFRGRRSNKSILTTHFFPFWFPTAVHPRSKERKKTSDGCIGYLSLNPFPHPSPLSHYALTSQV